MTHESEERELWIVGLGADPRRGTVVREYLAAGGYRARIAGVEELTTARPLGIVLDISPFSHDGWGIMLRLKADPATRTIPILPVYLSEEGKVGGVFPVAGFFTLPVDGSHLVDRLGVLGLTQELDDYDLQALIVSRRGEEDLTRLLTQLGFEVVNAYTGKEAVALSTTGRYYLIFSSFMLPDLSTFELMERLRLYPQTRNIPLFVLLKEGIKEGERVAMSRQIEHLVRKKELTMEEFLAHLRKR